MSLLRASLENRFGCRETGAAYKLVFAVPFLLIPLCCSVSWLNSGLLQTIPKSPSQFRASSAFHQTSSHHLPSSSPTSPSLLSCILIAHGATVCYPHCSPKGIAGLGKNIKNHPAKQSNKTNKKTPSQNCRGNMGIDNEKKWKKTGLECTNTFLMQNICGKENI